MHSADKVNDKLQIADNEIDIGVTDQFSINEASAYLSCAGKSDFSLFSSIIILVVELLRNYI